MKSIIKPIKKIHVVFDRKKIFLSITPKDIFPYTDYYYYFIYILKLLILKLFSKIGNCDLKFPSNWKSYVYITEH